MSEEKCPPCVLKPDAEFHGLVQLTGPGRIDGRVDGEIVGSDLLWIGASARVKARVTAPEIVIAGELEGEARADRRIELLSSARVVAALDAPSLVLAEGSLLEGSCRTHPRPPFEKPDPTSNQSPFSS
jgi:cytoskeletal protein CcmA (bactofilin family)